MVRVIRRVWAALFLRPKVRAEKMHVAACAWRIALVALHPGGLRLSRSMRSRGAARSEHPRQNPAGSARAEPVLSRPKETIRREPRLGATASFAFPREFDRFARCCVSRRSGRKHAALAGSGRRLAANERARGGSVPETKEVARRGTRPALRCPGFAYCPLRHTARSFPRGRRLLWRTGFCASWEI